MKFCEICRIIIRCLKWIPVIFIVSIIAWSYFAYIFALCVYYVDDIFEKIFMILFYHIFLIIFLWSYAQTIFTYPSRPRHDFYLSSTEMDRYLSLAESSTEDQNKYLEQLVIEKSLPMICRDSTGYVRFCQICACFKPDRAHHCSTCNDCILKMDHHCPWVNNCVGFHNYKYFVLFLLQGVLYCLYIALSSLRHFYRYWNEQYGLKNHILGFNIVFLFLVAFLFSIALSSLGLLHVYFTMRNKTTLESFRKPHFTIESQERQSNTTESSNGKKVHTSFSLGIYRNFRQVFGDNYRLWCFPIHTAKGNGINYPTRSNKYDMQQMAALI